MAAKCLAEKNCLVQDEILNDEHQSPNLLKNKQNYQGRTAYLRLLFVSIHTKRTLTLPFGLSCQ